MTDATADAAFPALAGGPTPKTGDSRKTRAQLGDPFLGVPPEAYEQPYIRAGLFGKHLLVADPAGVKHVLVDNVANYPKTALERRFFSAVFGNGLLSSEGDTWRAHRRAMSPSFDPRSVTAYAPLMSGITAEFAQRWEALADGDEIDMRTAMTELTLHLISATVFSADREEAARVVGEAMHAGQKTFGVGLWDILPGIGDLLYARRVRRARETFAGVDALVARLVRDREAAGDSAPQDLLSRLIAARDAETGIAMTPEEVRDQIVTIFLAGHETTATAMSWIWYLLSQHPAQEARLHAELDTVLGGRVPTAEDVPNLKYTRMLVDEAMRLYPPAPGISNRVALKDDVIEGQRVKAGAQIYIVSWILHRHRLLWSDPDRFDPERFSPDRSAGRPRFAYMPFGGGPRICIGAMMATTEIIMILATLAQRFSLRLAPGARVIPRPQVTLGMAEGLRMVIEKR